MDMELIRKVEYPVLGQRPVEILRSRLYQNRETLQISLSLDLRNVSGKTVTAVYLDLCCFDAAVNLIATKTMEPLEKLDIADNEDFGGDHMVDISSLRTRSITATVHRVCYSDGTLWDCNDQTEDSSKKHLFSSLGEDLKDGWLDHNADKHKGSFKRRLAWALIPVVLLAGLGAGFLSYQDTQESRLHHALTLFQEKDYTAALAEFDSLEQGWLLKTSLEELRWYQALCHIQKDSLIEAAGLLLGQPNHPPSVACLMQLNSLLSGVVSAGESHTVALCTDGTALATGKDDQGQCQVSRWQGLVAIAAGSNHTLGLKTNGKVLYAGNADGEKSAVENWDNVIGIAAGESHSVAVLANGRVVAAGDNTFGQCDTGGWSGVVAVAAGKNHTVALRQDGTVYATGDNPNGCCNVEKWKDVVAVAAGDGFTLALRAEGKILATGNADCWGSLPELSVPVVSISAGTHHSIALGTDGEVYSGGADDLHQSRIDHWQSILCSAGGNWHSVGVRTDGTAVSSGANTAGQGEVGNWSKLGLPKKALRLTAIDSYINQVE